MNRPSPDGTPNSKSRADSDRSDIEGERQLDALDESMRQATAQQPEEYRDVANEEKIVEIGADKTANPIQGIDPDKGAEKVEGR